MAIDKQYPLPDGQDGELRPRPEGSDQATSTKPGPKPEASLLESVPTIVWVPFSCDLEIRDRAKFQQEGHYVNSTISSERVYILTYSPKGNQLLRVQGETQLGAMVAMRESALGTLYGMWAQEQIQDAIQKQFRIINEERNKLAQFMAFHYAQELEGIIGANTPVFELAIHFLRKERARWWVRLRGLLPRRRARASQPQATQPPEAGTQGQE